MKEIRKSKHKTLTFKKALFFMILDWVIVFSSIVGAIIFLHFYVPDEIHAIALLITLIILFLIVVAGLIINRLLVPSISRHIYNKRYTELKEFDLFAYKDVDILDIFSEITKEGYKEIENGYLFKRHISLVDETIFSYIKDDILPNDITAYIKEENEKITAHLPEKKDTVVIYIFRKDNYTDEELKKISEINKSTYLLEKGNLANFTIITELLVPYDSATDTLYVESLPLKNNMTAFASAIRFIQRVVDKGKRAE